MTNNGAVFYRWSTKDRWHLGQGGAGTPFCSGKLGQNKTRASLSYPKWTVCRTLMLLSLLAVQSFGGRSCVMLSLGSDSPLESMRAVWLEQFGSHSLLYRRVREESSCRSVRISRRVYCAGAQGQNQGECSREAKRGESKFRVNAIVGKSSRGHWKRSRIRLSSQRSSLLAFR